MRLLVNPQRNPLRGTVAVPGDKSISHRAVMLASLAQGQSSIRNWLPAGDTLATLGAMRKLGVTIEVEESNSASWRISIQGVGLHGLSEPKGAIDCRSAGTCIRLLSGIAAGQSFPITLDGSDQLRRRPMRRVTGPLRQMGAEVLDRAGHAPLHFHPSRLQGVSYQMPVASAQVKSAVLLAGLYAEGRTEVIEPAPTRDHTERLLEAMGAIVDSSGGSRSVRGPLDGLNSLDMEIPGDFSSAAFLLVAAAIVPHSGVIITGTGVNETRTGLLDIMEEMGARVELSNRSESGGEPSAALKAQFEELHECQVGGNTVVRAIDEFPAWVVAATQASGKSVLREASELRVKEVDRISLVATELNRLGAKVEELADGLGVTGPTRLSGGEVDSHGDHRLGMALAVAGLAAAKPVIVHDAGCIADSFPNFVDIMRSLGADIRWLE